MCRVDKGKGQSRSVRGKGWKVCRVDKGKGQERSYEEKIGLRNFFFQCFSSPDFLTRAGKCAGWARERVSLQITEKGQ